MGAKGCISYRGLWVEKISFFGVFYLDLISRKSIILVMVSAAARRERLRYVFFAFCISICFYFFCRILSPPGRKLLNILF